MKKLLLAALPLIALSSCSINIHDFNHKHDTTCEFWDNKTETLQIETANIEKIDVEIDVGDCIINFGESGNVDIVGQYRCGGYHDKDKISKILDNIKIKYEIKNDTLYVSFDEIKKASLISCTTDLEITLPKSFSDFDISTDVGDIMLNGLCGKFDVSADVGTVTAENTALNDDSKFKADVGDVNVSLANVAECELEISVDVGDIKLDTQGIGYTEKDVSKDYVSKQYELLIDEKCRAELSADVGDINIRK